MEDEERSLSLSLSLLPPIASEPVEGEERGKKEREGKKWRKGKKEVIA